MNPDLKKFFTPQAIVDSMARLPELKTPVMDLLFTNRPNHPYPIVGKKDLGLPSGNIPVVRRSAQSLAVSSPGQTVEFIEPQPVKPNEFLTGADLNNFQNLMGESKQTLIDNKIDILRRSCRATAEALCIQALTGKISYPMSEGGGAMGTYTVDFGTIVDASAQVATMFDAAGVKLSAIIKAISAVLDKLKEKVDGNDVFFAVGFDAYAALCDIVGAQVNGTVIQAMTDGISIGGGIKINLLPSTYKNLKTGAAVPVVPLKHMLVIDKQAGHKLIYAALDSMDSGFQPFPFFATLEEIRDPSGVKIIGESKPLPVVNVNGIVKAKILT